MDETFWGLTQTGWTAIAGLAAGATFVVAALAALYARRQIGLAISQAHDARQAAIEADRPYVVVSVESSEVSRQFVDLVVRNIGRRPAVKVEIELDPPPMRAQEEPGHELASMRLLTEPVAQIAPGQELRAFYDSQIDRAGRDDLPTEHSVRVTYFDTAGRRYEEASVLDLEALKGALYTEVYTVHHVAKALRDIQSTLKKSPLGSGRALPVEASVESREAKHERQRLDLEKRRAAHDDLVARMVQPGRDRRDE